MPEIRTLPVHSCNRGDLTVFENVLPGRLKNVSYLRNIEGDTTKQTSSTWQAIICLQGACEIHVEDFSTKQVVQLDKPNEAIILKPDESYFLNCSSKNTLVLVLISSEEQLKYECMDYKPSKKKGAKLYA